MDQGRYSEAFRISHPEWAKQYQEGTFIQLSEAVRRPLGEVQSRTLVGDSAQPLTTGFIGNARMYSFRTRFKNAATDRTELVGVLKGENEDSWRPAGYLINMQ